MTTPESTPVPGTEWAFSVDGRRARVLIADDDSLVRETLVSFIQGLGYDAVAVGDGTAAIEAVAAHPPDLVLSDVVMPGLSGFDVCRKLKADPSTRFIPVVLVTGVGNEHKVEGIEAGADDFLGKPVSLEELQARVRSLLRMKAYLDQMEHVETVLCTLARSIEEKDQYTQGHCQHLADYSVALGRFLGLPEEDLTALQRGGYLHDLGKVAVPDAILQKNGPLTPGERAIMERHPVVGEEICRPLHSLRAVLPIIRHHHEHGDGSGYPDGLQGDAIPLTARVLQVTDVYDALTTNRPYRRALSPQEALEVIDAEVRRGWWDGKIARAFREISKGIRQVAD